MDMTITGLPDPPTGMSQVCESKLLAVGDCTYFPVSMEWRHVKVGDSCIGKYGLIAIPAPLTGTDWLDAQEPGTVFEFLGKGFLIARNRTIGKAVVPLEAFEKFAVCYGSESGWYHLQQCFPDGHETLSDETCEILHPRKE